MHTNERTILEPVPASKPRRPRINHRTLLLRDPNRFERIIHMLYTAHTDKLIHTERDVRIRELTSELIECTALLVDGVEQTQVRTGVLKVVDLKASQDNIITGLLHFELPHLLDANGDQHKPPVRRRGRNQGSAWRVNFNLEIIPPRPTLERITTRPAFADRRD